MAGKIRCHLIVVYAAYALYICDNTSNMLLIKIFVRVPPPPKKCFVCTYEVSLNCVKVLFILMGSGWSESHNKLFLGSFDLRSFYPDCAWPLWHAKLAFPNKQQAFLCAWSQEHR